MAGSAIYKSKDTSNFFVIKLNLEGICTYANEAYFNRFTEYKDTFIGASYKDIIHTEDLESLEEGIAFCLNNPAEIYTTTIRKPMHAGGNYYCYCEFSAIVNSDKKPEGVQCIAFEVTAYEVAIRTANQYLKQTESILDNIVDGFFAIDFNEDIISANKVFYTITGLKQYQVIGKKVSEVFKDGYERFYPSYYKTALTGKESVVFEEYYPQVNMWFRATLYPATQGVFVFFSDITEKKKAEEQLNKVQKEFETVFNGTSDTLFLIEVNDNNKFTYLRNNLAHQQLTGIHVDKFRNHTPQEVVGEKLGNILSSNYQRCVDAKEPVVYEETLDLPAGRKTWYTMLSPIMDGNRVAYIVGSSTDITNYKNQEQVIRDYLGKFQQLSFLTSHELRHEYAKIQGIINTLDEGIDPAVVKEIKHSIEKINAIIYKLNDNLSFSQTKIATKSNTQSYGHVLLVDDDEVFNYLSARTLKKAKPGIDINAVGGVDEALQFLKENDKLGNYIIFLDLNMPGKTGWDFLDAYQKFEIKSNVVILTSSIDNEDRAKAHTYQTVVDFITKPLLLETAQAILSLGNKEVAENKN